MRSGAREKRSAAWRTKNAQRPATAALMGYAEMKAHFTMLVAALARAEPQLGPWMTPAVVTVAFQWHEQDRKRDPDGVRAAAKFVLDGLVAAGVLARDTAAAVDGFVDTFTYDGRRQAGVFVKLEADADRKWTAFFPFRFPDFNEILAARGRDGMLTERTRQARRAR